MAVCIDTCKSMGGTGGVIYIIDYGNGDFTHSHTYNEWNCHREVLLETFLNFRVVLLSSFWHIGSVASLFNNFFLPVVIRS